jgi:hypothetical protein
MIPSLFPRPWKTPFLEQVITSQCNIMPTHNKVHTALQTLHDMNIFVSALVLWQLKSPEFQLHPAMHDLQCDILDAMGENPSFIGGARSWACNTTATI